MLQGMRELQPNCPVIADVHGSGLFIGMELIEAGSNREANATAADNIVQLMRRKKVLFSTDGSNHNVVKIKPSVLNKENAVFFLEQLDKTLRELVY